MAGLKKKHHIIPRFYLQNFTDENGFVWVLDTKDKIIKVKPENILFENHFYTITLKSGEKSVIVEDTLANIEGDFAGIYKNKISRDKFLTLEERAKVAIFVSAMMHRTRAHRDSIRNALVNLKKTMEEWKTHFELNPKAREFASSTPLKWKFYFLKRIK